MSDLIYYDPLLFKTPKGVVKKQTKVEFKVKFEKEFEPNQMVMLLRCDTEESYSEHVMQKFDDRFVFEHTFENRGHYWYLFRADFDGYSKFISKTFHNYSYLSDQQGEPFFQLVTEKEYECTDSLQGGLIYQIFVDRFCREGEVKQREPLILRDDWGGGIKKNTTDPLIINLEVFGGNFKGIIKKLDYLKGLGVTTIYLNPISQANSSHKYDTADYKKVDDMFGTEQDFKDLIDKAQKKGIKIIIDGVYNHTGSDSIYFNKENRFNSNGAYNSKNSPYYDWFDWIEYPDKYQSWWGIDTLPAIKEESEDFAEFIAGDNGVIEKFMNLGVFGVRLDVVDEIRDKFVKKISDRVKKHGRHKVIMGEVWEDASTKISYGARREYFADNELNSVMNYPIKESILNYMRSKEPTELVSTIRMLQNNYPKVIQDNLMNFLTTHDTNRAFSELEKAYGGDKELAKKLLKICFALLYTVTGVPSIFYGDEYGMENNDGSSRGCFDWNNNENELYEFVKRLGIIRQLSVLKDGDLNILCAEKGKFVFERIGNGERLVTLVNMQNTPLQVNLDGKYASLISGEEKNNFTLGEYEFEILIEQK